MKSRTFLFSVLIVGVSLISAIGSAQRRLADDKPITGDFKITIRTTVAGQSSESTTMIKGARERAETSMGAAGFSTKTVTITQCDMRRTIQINDSARKYLLTPMDADGSSSSNDAATADASPTSSASHAGGVVTMTVNTVDTGERKDMFGFTARHLMRTTIMQSSPDACHPGQIKVETDGWYINLEYGLSCPANRPPQTGRPSAPGGCRDRYVYKRTGPENLGYPLQETTTMYGANGAAAYTTTKEVIELSRQSLDTALFDIPAGYTEARSQEEMYAAPSMAEMMEMAKRQQGQQGNESQAPTTKSANTAAKIRVGVVEFNNKTKTSVSTDSLRDQLIASLASKGIDAIALNATSPSEAAVEAQAKQCTYVLYTEIATLKAPSPGKKIGGLFGRATGVGSSDSGKAEVRLDFRLLATGSSSPTAQSSASAKQDTQDASVSEAIQSEAQAVAAALSRP
jgi:hypothetical protein